MPRQSHAWRQVNFPMVRYSRGGEWWIVNARAGNRDFETGLGLMLRIQRTATGYATAVVSPAVFFPCFGAIDHDPEADRMLGEALRSGAVAQSELMRREPHDRDASCLLHVEQYCFSKLFRIDGGSGGSHAAPTHRAGAARTYSEQEVRLRT